MIDANVVFVYICVALYVFWWLANNICDRCNGLLTAWLFYGNLLIMSLLWPLTIWYIMITERLPFAIGRQSPMSPEEIRELFTPTPIRYEPIAWRTRSHFRPPVAWN